MFVLYIYIYVKYTGSIYYVYYNIDIWRTRFAQTISQKLNMPKKTP